MAELEIRPTAAMRVRVTGIIVAAGMIAGVLVWLLTGGGVGLFARKAHLKTYMPDATGLAVNSPVRLNGIQVGVVKHVAISEYLDRQRAVHVDFDVETGFLPKIPADSQTSIGSDTLIGNKFVDVAAGKNPLPVVDGGVLLSEPSESAADKADLILSLQNSLKKVDDILAQVASPDTQIGRYVVGEKEYDQALRSMDAFEGAMRSLVVRSPASDVVFTTNLYTKMQQPLIRIDTTLQDIQRGEGELGRLYASDEQYNTIVNDLRDLRKTIQQIRTDMEKYGPGLRDDEAYRKVRRLLASTDAQLAALNRGEGATGELLISPQLYESLVGSLTSMEAMVRDFRENPKKYLRTKLF